LTPKRACAVGATATPLKKVRLDGSGSALQSLLLQLQGEPAVGRVEPFQLGDAVRHVAKADGGRLERLVVQAGAPPFYYEPHEGSTFRSLCRIIVGQQLAGSAVKAIWLKFIAALGGDVAAVTPEHVLQQNLLELQAKVGLSGAKARTIADLAAHYVRGDLSDAVLLSPSLSGAARAAKLQAVKGIGPWSVNMFSMFVLQLPDTFPTGDLGVRNGIGKAFGLRGSGKGGALDEKKDAAKLQAAFAPYSPYRSVASWYMWRVCETPSFMEE